MDRKSVIVLIICFALFMLWDQFTRKYYPPKPLNRTNDVATATTLAPAVPANAPTTVGTSPDASWNAPKPGAPEELLVVDGDVARYTFTSHGGGLKQVELLKYLESVGCNNKGTVSTHPVATLNAEARQPVMALIGSESLSGDGLFKLSKFSGRWTDNSNSTRFVSGVRAEKLLPNGLFLVKEFELASNYLVNVRVQFENRSDETLELPVQQWVAGTATPLNAKDDQHLVGLQWRSAAGKTDRKVDRGYFDNKTLGCFAGTPIFDYRYNEHTVSWVSAHNQFFFVSLIPASPAAEVTAARFDLPMPTREQILAVPGTLTNQFAIQVNMHFSPTNLAAGQVMEQKFLLYAGPKEYRTIERIAAELKNGLDAVMGYGGFFGFFSRLLLLSMNGLNALGLSYGLAIIAITVIIKSLFWPLTAASTRSMKRMQALQPQMKAIQEKFKEDPTKMNKKMMEFMKENKVSPLGGCLPLILQIPVFIGFFQMVQSAIELRGASFLWACDLSSPDTIFTIPGIDFNVNPLPLLMGGTMLWQASLTPPSPGMDPAQQKLMKYFPLIFLFMLYNYSSGLTLYWTVQNLLSIAQMKLTKTVPIQTPKPVSAVAPAPPRKKK